MHCLFGSTTPGVSLMCSHDDRVEDGGERTASRVEEAIALAPNGAYETMVSDNGKSASAPTFLNSNRRTLEAADVLVLEGGKWRTTDKHLKTIAIEAQGDRWAALHREDALSAKDNPLGYRS